MRLKVRHYPLQYLFAHYRVSIIAGRRGVPCKACHLVEDKDTHPLRKCVRGGHKYCGHLEVDDNGGFYDCGEKKVKTETRRRALTIDTLSI